MEPSITNLTYAYYGDLIETDVLRTIPQPAVSMNYATADNYQISHYEVKRFDRWAIPNGGRSTDWYITQDPIYGFKAFNADMSCRGKLYSIGQTNIEDCIPMPCVSGMHYCPNLMDVYRYYFLEPDTKIAIVRSEQGGVTVTKDFSKFCTNKLRVFRLLSGTEITSVLYCELSRELNRKLDIPGQIRGLCLTAVYQSLVSKFNVIDKSCSNYEP